jgi:hypothetical protein
MLASPQVIFLPHFRLNGASAALAAADGHGFNFTWVGMEML